MGSARIGGWLEVVLVTRGRVGAQSWSVAINVSMVQVK